jgi:hypothetical protein
MIKNSKLPCLSSIIILFCSIVVSAQNESGIIYKQKVARDDVPIRQAVGGTKGIIYLTSDSVIFRSRNERNIGINFNIGYTEIKKVKRINYLFFPNRILIKLKDEEKYRLFTYRRRTIVEEIRKRLN